MAKSYPWFRPLIFTMLAAAGAAAACGPGTREDAPDADGPGPTVDAAPTPDAIPTGPPWDDFPAAPVLDSGAPANAADLFAVPNGPVVGPCLVEPQLGTMYPNNWLRPRFRVAPTTAQDLFEIRLHAEDQINDLVVYTTSPSWTMPQELWAKLSAHVVDAPITVTVRGADFNGTTLTGPPSLGSSGTISIAPVDATGAIVYWTTSGGTALRGFAVGSETVKDVLRPPQTQSQCIGCHSSTPDGLFVGFSATNDSGDGRPARVDLRTVDGLSTVPSFITADAAALLTRQPQQAPTFSAAHWTPGDHLALSLYQIGSKTEIAWTDLEAASQLEGLDWGLLARNGDTRSAAAAVWAHDGVKVAYVSGTNVDSGVRHFAGDIYTVPFANGAGGTATPLAGASDPVLNEFYPSFSADDRWIAFNRSPDNPTGGSPPSYDNKQAEVFIVPAGGGSATRLAANDPPTCGGVATSPGVTNSWPKWSPAAQTRDGKTYYWLTFSSKRGGGTGAAANGGPAAGVPQIYVTGVVVDELGVTTYPALYLWNQPATEANHTPAWDVLQIE